MPHKRRPRRNKTLDMLVTTDNVVRMPQSAFRQVAERENYVSRMTLEERVEAVNVIYNRYESARQQTEAMAEKMDKWDKQYDGIWQDPTIDSEKIFLPKTREQVQVVYAYIMLMVSQLDPLVTMTPQVTSIWASNEEYKRAKVAEALTDYHFDDLWKIRDDVFPRWLKAFLKYSMAVWKVTYREDNYLPDLNIDVVDRALLYIDPQARDIKRARWVIERYWLPRSEVQQRIDEKHWYVSENGMDRVIKGTSQIPERELRRYYGENFQQSYSVEEDDLVECWDYWQAPTKGLQDVYATILGGETGELVRYGRNPYPYKGIPFRGKSFDPNEFRPDGTPLTEQYRPFQEVINNFLNMRITDVRKNIIRPVAMTGRFVDAQTQADFQDGHKIVRLAEEALEASKDPQFDLRKHVFELPFQTSTQELLVADLPFVLGQGKESTNVSDVFRGQAPPHQATLGQIQEQLSRNQGVFRPIYLQVMRSFEELAEISMEYFRDPDFFPTSRIIQIVGKNRYADVIADWHNPGGNMFVREVTADEMDVDVTIDAVNAADALASRTFLITSLEQIFQSIGQIPELFAELKNELNFPRVVEMMLNASGHDIEALRLSPKQKEEKQKRDAQMQQQAMEMQIQMATLSEQVKAMGAEGEQAARAKGQIAVDRNKANLERANERDRIVLETDSMIEQIVTKITAQLKADMVTMKKEAELEKQNEASSVGHGNNVNA